MSNSEQDPKQLTLKTTDARDNAAKLAAILKTHAEMLEGSLKGGSGGDSAKWPCVWAGAIASSFGYYAFTSEWTGGAPHPWWTAETNVKGDSWNAWLTATWAGAGEFYDNPANWVGKPVWFTLAGGGGIGGAITLSLYASNGGPQIGQFGAYLSGLGGCSFSGWLTYQP